MQIIRIIRIIATVPIVLVLVAGMSIAQMIHR